LWDSSELDIREERFMDREFEGCVGIFIEDDEGVLWWGNRVGDIFGVICISKGFKEDLGESEVVMLFKVFRDMDKWR